jgi:hypothetical protein
MSENVPPLHIVADIADIAGLGLMLTVSVKGVPAQLPLEGVTVYVAMLTALVLFTRVPLIPEALLPEAPPVKPDPEGADHEYFVADGIVPSGPPSTGVTVNRSPLHTVLVIEFTAGFGLIVTATVKEGPGHVPAVGVTE